MKISFTFLLTLFCGCIWAAGYSLSPKPKSVVQAGPILSFNNQWRAVSSEKYPAVEWLKTTLEQRSGVAITENSFQTIRFEPLLGAKQQEQYELEINASGIILKAAGPKGYFRAVGRLLEILQSPMAEWSSKGVRLPQLKITDYPDFPVRMADLTMAFWEPFSDAERLDSTKRIIEILAVHGMNYIVIELGGNYQSVHFKSIRPTPWSEKDVREVVRFANARGIIAIPGINTIGHFGRAPNICALQNAKGSKVGHDVRRREFYELYAAVLDELMDWFDHPPYCRVGGDESSEIFNIFKTNPQESAKLFAKVFNFAAGHLEKYNCKAILWHDMLFSKVLGGEQVNEGFTETRIKVAQEAIDLLSRKIIVNYWNYGKANRYEGIDILRKAGFEVWASTWNTTDAISALANYAYKHGVVGFNATTWCNNHTKGGSLLYAAECAWNANTSKPLVDYEELFLREWNPAPAFKHPENASAIIWEDGAKQGSVNPIHVGNLLLTCSDVVGAGKTTYQTLKHPEDVITHKKSHPQAVFLMKGGERFVMQIPIINAFRAANSFALYTPSHGISTQQNKWGEDWFIRNGKVYKKSIYEPNQPIPSDGGILSANTTGADVHNNVRRILYNNRVEIIAVDCEKNRSPLIAKLKTKTQKVILLFDADYQIFAEPVKNSAVITFQNAQGAEKIVLKSDFGIAPDPRFTPGFEKVVLPEGRVAVIWTRNPQKTEPYTLEISISDTGMVANVRVLAAVEME